MSNDDWQVGDLALCVDESPVQYIDGLPEAKPEYVNALKRGRIYTVTHIVFGRTVKSQMGLGDAAARAGGRAERFRKIYPHIPDAEDAETIRLLNQRERVA